MSDHHEKTLSGDMNIPDGHILRKVPLIAGIVGLAALGGAFAVGGSDTGNLYRAYLVAFIFFLSFALGGMWHVLIHHAAKAGWSVTTRRIGENMMSTVPVLVLLFIPIAFLGLGDVFPWVDPEAWGWPAHEAHLVEAKHAFLNPTAFLIRAAIYFAAWIAIGWFFYSKSVAQDKTGAHEHSRKMSLLSPIGIMLFALTLTGASFDWIMSTDPRWFSTIFGLYYFAGCAICCYAGIALISMVLKGTGVVKDDIHTEHFHGMGKMLFGFTVFWSYIAFSQYMLYWYANMPEETAWFMRRGNEGWLKWSYVLAIGHFIVPFFFLMSRHTKRRTLTFALGACWLLVMHALDMYWLVLPTFNEGGLGFGAVHALTLIGVGGVWVAFLFWRMGRAAVVPVKDPRLAESLAFENK